MSTDLWGHGWRVAAVDEWGNHARDDDWNYEDPDVDLHMNGGCWDWAIAHQRQNPHLRIGQEWRWNPPEERDDPEEEWTPIHAFTHDDHWAYDARGAFPLSEWRKWKGWDDVTFNHEPRDIGAGPSWPRPNPAMDELVSRNRTRPPSPGGGPVFLADRARHRPHPDLAESLRAHGTVHTTGGRVLPGRRTAVADTATQQSRLADPAGWSHHVAIAPSGLAVAGARAYASLRGLDDPHDTDYSGIMQSPERVARVGRHYDAMPDHDPAALPHYHAMLKEVGDQYDFMTNRLGIRVQPVDYDPYAHVGEMMADINGNRTLKVLGTHITGGHPVFGNEGNDKFRAVHDFFGHAATGRDFDRHGEHATYLAHARMFSPHAVPALTNETLGQNSSLILNGHFGPQKIGTIPRHHTAHRTAMADPAAAWDTDHVPYFPMSPSNYHDMSNISRHQSEGWNGDPRSYRSPYFYHATDAELQPGDALLPRSQTGVESKWGYGDTKGMETRNDFVWMWPSRAKAIAYAGSRGNFNNTPSYKYVYKVKPDDQPVPWNGSGKDGHVANSATVIGLVHRTAHRTAGANGDLPPDMTITRKEYPRTNESSWHAYHDGQEIASLWVMPSDYSDKGAIADVTVHDDAYLRRGVATALWNAAGRPAHTPGKQSGPGKAWALSVGGDQDLSNLEDEDDDSWFYTAHRTAIMANCSDDEYMTGQCAAWAIAHQREHPHLRLGIDWQRLTPDHPDWDEEDDGDEVWQPQHVFTHDDTYAYDVRGAHPLAEVKQWDDVTLNHSPEDVMATGMYEGGYEPSAEVVQRVRPHHAHRTVTTAAVTVPVGSQHGLHTTPSMLISNAVKRTGWPVWFSDEAGTRIDARDPLAVMSLGARHSAPITVHCDHPDIAAHIADYVAQDHD